MTQDCVNAFVRTVELRDLRALSEELKSVILFISKLSGRATPLQSENLILVWGEKKNLCSSLCTDLPKLYTNTAI